MVQWVTHLRDGASLTDDVLYPHEIEVLEAKGYKAEDITSVDRIVNGITLTLKSTGLDTFFVGTDESVDLALAGANVRQKQPEVTKRFIGGYIKGTDPPLQARLGMDPRTKTIFIEVVKVKQKAKLGINAELMEPKKHRFLNTYQRDLNGQIFIVYDSRYITGVVDTPLGEAPPTGFICSLKDTEKLLVVSLKKGGILLDVQ